MSPCFRPVLCPATVAAVAASVLPSLPASAGVTLYADVASWSSIPDTSVLGTADFSGYSGYLEETVPATGSVGDATWELAAPGGLIASGGVIRAAQAAVIFSRLGPAVSGFGGNFFSAAGLTDIRVEVDSGGRTYAFDRFNVGPSTFWGFRADEFPIESFRVYVGGAAVSNLALMAGGLVPPIPAPFAVPALLAAAMPIFGVRRRAG